MKKELTLKEIKNIESKEHPIKTQVYEKYGTLKKKYLEEHRPDILWTLGKELPEYLHQIDEKADAMYEELYSEFSKKEEYQKTGDFKTDLIKEQEIKNRIETIILETLIYSEE